MADLQSIGFLQGTKTIDYGWGQTYYDTARSLRSADGLVTLHGLAKVEVSSNPLVAGDVIGEVDEAHRPAFGSVHNAVANNGIVRVSVKPDGKIVYEALAGSPTSVDKFISFQGIAFLGA
mgnify:CR=1 FL=1